MQRLEAWNGWFANDGVGADDGGDGDEVNDYDDAKSLLDFYG